MITWATLVAALAIWGLGRTALSLVPVAGERSRLEEHSLSVLLGLALWAALIAGAGLADPIATLGRSAGFGATAVAIAAGFFAAWRARCARCARASDAPPAAREPWKTTERLAAGLVLILAAFAVFYAASMPVHIFDPVFHFAYKGKLLYYEGLMGPGWTDVEDAVGRVITHPDYPPGVGAIEALVAALTGSFEADAARPLFALFVLGVAGLLFARLRESSRRAALTGSLMWLALPFLYYSRLPHPDWVTGSLGLFLGPDAGERLLGLGDWTMPDGWTLDGAGDLPLAALFSAGALLLFSAVFSAASERRRGDFALAGLLLGGGALMKNEGLALLPVALVAVLLSYLATRATARRAPRAALRPVALTFGLALVVASPWLLVRGSAPTTGEDYPARLSPSGLLTAAASTQPMTLDTKPPRVVERRVPRIVAGGFLTAFCNLPRFGLLWLLFFGVLGFTLARRRERLAGTPLATALAVLGASALYALVLVVTPWNLDTLFRTAIPDRLIFHVAPLAIFALVLLLEEPDESAADQPS